MYLQEVRVNLKWGTRRIGKLVSGIRRILVFDTHSQLIVNALSEYKEVIKEMIDVQEVTKVINIYLVGSLESAVLVGFLGIENEN